MITNHTQLLNWLIEKYGLKSYTEIGVQNPKNNYDKIICEDKEGCDPEPLEKRNGIFTLTSDQYFNHFPDDIHRDIFFIDGLHHADQVRRDFENSLRCLNDNGFIVIHDTLPENEEGTLVPRQKKQWWGDVYKWAMTLDSYDGISHITVNMDNGCTVIRKCQGKKGVPIIYEDNNVSWSEFVEHKESYYNIIQPSEIENYL